ncbi:hypothetical protein SAICODRAFT_93301 [Saitoella complicata NRRL Y-17804]|nr:uncharacterized protein SAICODRAFT_93301 [Saitoella complicata NRRL Y-17804]ODQ52456.1 hypothetical protein SAICODRAFT_93301 [Saitoella complicata NRRL Y-17804]
MAHARMNSANALSANTIRLSKSAGVEESLKTYRTLEALRSGDAQAIDRALQQYLADTAQSNDGPRASTGSRTSSDISTPLHLAVQCASHQVVEHIILKNIVDINTQDKDGNTALHLAAALARDDVVQLLMQQSNVNDTIPNNDGKQPFQVATTPELADTMQLSRAQYTDFVSNRFKQLVQAGDLQGVEQLFTNPRAVSLCEVSRQDPETGSTLLHDAAKAKNLELVQFLLDRGADPFRRDKKGKLPWEVTKDDKIKHVLKRSPAAQSVVTTTPGEPIKMAGYLKKWTNYTTGYKLRWFVLENDVLSYYKNQDDAQRSCRGSIHMKYASLNLDKQDKQRFEITGKGSVRYHLRANHPVEANRWAWALTAAIQHAKDSSRRAGGGAGDAPPSPLPGLIQSEINDASSGDLRRTASLTSMALSEADSLAGSEPESVIEPYKDTFGTTANYARAQLSVLGQVADSLMHERELRVQQGTQAPPSPQMSNALQSFRDALAGVQRTVEEVLNMSAERDQFWRYKLARENDIMRLWEENMRALAVEQEQLQEEFHNVNVERRKTKKALREAHAQLSISSPSAEETTFAESFGGVEITDRDQSVVQSMARIPTIPADEDDDEDEFFDAIAGGEIQAEPLPPVVQQPVQQEVYRAPSTYQATQVAAPPQIQVSAIAAAAPVVPAVEKQVHAPVEEDEPDALTKSYHGYEEGTRQKLAMDDDNRPKISLWGILKSMIGKDMTKMTLPVSFNEPTSLLQRVAEDMEYADLLDTAATRTESTERLLYVAAFAASEYCSTTNRIAKPFNPLLGETYEYVRPDKQYRFVVEQVSHHPPVGAAIAQSPKWDYWGESAVKSKFTGKSFDINPLGTWFCRIRAPSGKDELYTWKKVNTSVVGIITGSPTVDNYGEMIVKNHTTGDVCTLDFKQRGWRGGGAYEVKGTVADAQGSPRWSVAGHWNDKIYARKLDGKASILPEAGNASTFLIWQAHPRPPAPFNLTPFAITLNAPQKSLVPWLPPTDTRLRPDQRAMEEGQYDAAATEKNRVEEKQRAARRDLEARGQHWEPRWFKQSVDKVTGETFWEYRTDAEVGGGYWDVREKRAWQGFSPDIF